MRLSCLQQSWRNHWRTTFNSMALLSDGAGPPVQEGGRKMIGWRERELESTGWSFLECPDLTGSSVLWEVLSILRFYSSPFATAAEAMGTDLLPGAVVQ